VLKKCVKLPVLAHLVKESGILLWLLSVISVRSEGSDGSESSWSRVTELALEVKHCYKLLSAIVHTPSEGKKNRARDFSSFLHRVLAATGN